MEMQEFETLVQQLGYRGGYGGYDGYGGYAADHRAPHAYGSAAARRVGSGVPWSPTGSSRASVSPPRAARPVRPTSPVRLTSPRRQRYDFAPDEFYDGYARSAHWQALGTGTGARAVAVPLERCLSGYRPLPGAATLTPRRASSSGRARSAPRTRPLPATHGGSGGYGGYRPSLLDSLSYC